MAFHISALLYKSAMRHPDNFRSYTDEELDTFLKNMPFHQGYQAAVFEHERRLKLKDDEEAKKRDQASKERHEQAMRVGGWTLFWAIVAALGTVGLLLLDIPFSKLRHAITSLALPTSSPTATANLAQSPTPTATGSPSAIPQMSPTPSPASTPAP
jgi:hypothetical protein